VKNKDLSQKPGFFAHSYKAFRESIRGDRLIKLINLMLRSAECGLNILLQFHFSNE